MRAGEPQTAQTGGWDIRENSSRDFSGRQFPKFGAIDWSITPRVAEFVTERGWKPLMACAATGIFGYCGCAARQRFEITKAGRTADCQQKRAVRSGHNRHCSKSRDQTFAQTLAGTCPEVNSPNLVQSPRGLACDKALVVDYLGGRLFRRFRFSSSSRAIFSMRARSLLLSFSRAANSASSIHGSCFCV
jgi:hypothetical protein